MSTMAYRIGVTHFIFFSPPPCIVRVWIAFRGKPRRQAHETTRLKSQSRKQTSKYQNPLGSSSMWGDFPVYANIGYNNTYKLRLPPHLKWVHWQIRRRPVSVVFLGLRESLVSPLHHRQVSGGCADDDDFVCAVVQTWNAWQLRGFLNLNTSITRMITYQRCHQQLSVWLFTYHYLSKTNCGTMAKKKHVVNSLGYKWGNVVLVIVCIVFVYVHQQNLCLFVYDKYDKTLIAAYRNKCSANACGK